MGTLPLILLPPSEGKARGGEGSPWAWRTMAVDLDDKRDEVIAALARAMRSPEATRAKLLGVKGKALAAATAADRSVRTTPTMPAIDRYTGVLYDALDHSSLSAAERRRLAGSVLIFSGLWGVVAPTDPIPDYKLKMGATLPGLGRLSAFWRDALSDRVADMARDRRVWNLLPNEHAAAWLAPAGVQGWSVRFLERRVDGSLTAVSHWNKFLKGALVRFLIAHPDAGPKQLLRWNHPSGYRYEPALTEERTGSGVLSMVGPAT
jgi:cytoplasmic iron level regulating protein YaaA (DUF328/UPF0246 family)